MKRRLALSALLVLMLAITGCTGGARLPSNDETLLQADGFSEFDTSGRLGVGQRWLSAQQSAKLNAYRGLAHRLYYLPLDDQKTVGSQVMRHEIYRIYLDTYLRQARATDYRAVKDSLKTTLELRLTPRFYHCMGGDLTTVNRCVQEDGKLPFTRLGYNSAEVRNVNLACGRRDCSDQFYVKGFSDKRHAVDNALLEVGFYDVEWTVNTGIRVLFNYLLVNGFVNAL